MSGNTIKQLIAQIEVERAAAEKREFTALQEIQVILAAAQQEGRTALTEQEDSECDRLSAIVKDAQDAQEKIATKLAKAKGVEAEELAAEQRLARLHNFADGDSPKNDKSRERVPYDEVVRIGNEKRTYNPESDPNGKIFLTDVLRQFVSNDVRSADRLSRHMHEEEVERAGTHAGYQLRTSAGVGTSAFTGLVVPQYLIDMVAPAVANLRPFADVCNSHPLPAEGMSVNISRITTASSAALQASELDTVSLTDMDDTLLTANIQTAAGSQLVSRQALDRGAGIEDIVMQDLLRQLYTIVDSTLINQATYGLSAVANDNDYTDTTPTAAELYPLIVGAASQCATAVRGVATPTHAVMHPRRWYWMQSELTSTWPLISQPGIPTQAGGAANGEAGRLPCGLLVVSDANVPTDKGTNEDEIYVLPRLEAHLWEDAGRPVFIRAEASANASGTQNYAQLGVMLVVYEYFAYTFGRYANAVQKISDTGLIAPTGF